MKSKKVKKLVLNKAFIVNIILGVIICSLIALLFILNQPPKKEEFKNPYDIRVSDKDNFVLLGDSITDWYPVEEFFDDLPVVNSGIAGYHTIDILNNLKEMVWIYNPTKVFILIGTNDIGAGVEKKEVVSNIKKIIKEIKNLRPQAKIYLQSIYPVNNTDDEKINKDAVKSRDNKVIQDVNKSLKAYCQDSNVTYIDVYHELLDQEGNLKLKYTTDGLHMSNLGYLRVTKTLLPYFQD